MTTLSICAPINGENPKAPSVRLTVIRAHEETPPVGVKEPIDWVLLTTWPVEDAQAAPYPAAQGDYRSIQVISFTSDWRFSSARSREIVKSLLDNRLAG